MSLNLEFDGHLHQLQLVGRSQCSNPSPCQQFHRYAVNGLNASRTVGIIPPSALYQHVLFKLVLCWNAGISPSCHWYECVLFNLPSWIHQQAFHLSVTDHRMCRLRHADVLEWLWFLNNHERVVSEWMWGDKDTFRLAFALAGKEDNFWQVCVFVGLHWLDCFFSAVAVVLLCACHVQDTTLIRLVDCYQWLDFLCSAAIVVLSCACCAQNIAWLSYRRNTKSLQCNQTWLHRFCCKPACYPHELLLLLIWFVYVVPDTLLSWVWQVLLITWLRFCCCCPHLCTIIDTALLTFKRTVQQTWLIPFYCCFLLYLCMLNTLLCWVSEGSYKWLHCFCCAAIAHVACLAWETGTDSPALLGWSSVRNWNRYCECRV